MAYPSLSPFTTTLYSKSFTKLGTIGAPQALTATPRHNQQSTAELVLPATSPRLADLMADGTRAVITYQGSFLLSGPISSYAGKGPRSTATFTFQIADDWDLFNRMLAWPVPGAAIATQTAAEYDTRTGAAETVLKALVTANKAHGNASLVVAADLGRGTAITTTNRFHPVSERTIPLVDAAGLGTTVQQINGQLVMDCYPVRVYPRTLSEASGVVQDWSYSHKRDKATRVIVGGKGEGTARAFRSLVGTSAEAALGYSVEAFLDSTDSNNTTELDAKGTQFLGLNGPTNGLSISLSETPSFRYDPSGNRGVRVGDRIRLEVGPGVVITDVLRQCTIAWSADNGLNVTPQVGDRSDDPSLALAAVIAAVRRSVSNLRR